MRNVMTTARLGRRRAITSMLAMLYLVLFAMLAVGFTLDEIPNDITGETLAAFEPALDYVAVKVPRWAFEKFPGSDAALSTTMRSVAKPGRGTMAI